MAISNDVSRWFIMEYEGMCINKWRPIALGSIISISTVHMITVTGCADVLAPDHAWHKREGNVATVGCKHQNKTWHLKCHGSQWEGVVGNCNASGKVHISNHITIYYENKHNKFIMSNTEFLPGYLYLVLI